LTIITLAWCGPNVYRANEIFATITLGEVCKRVERLAG
jgi:hypothetical protein